MILSKLAEALGVTFSQLMAPAVNARSYIYGLGVSGFCETMNAAFCADAFHRCCRGAASTGCSIRFRAEAETGNFVAHRSGVEEYIYVLRGSMRATIGDQRVTLNQGDSLYFQADADHSFLNLGKTQWNIFW